MLKSCIPILHSHHNTNKWFYLNMDWSNFIVFIWMKYFDILLILWRLCWSHWPCCNKIVLNHRGNTLTVLCWTPPVNTELLCIQWHFLWQKFFFHLLRNGQFVKKVLPSYNMKVSKFSQLKYCQMWDLFSATTIVYIHILVLSRGGL